MTARVETCGRGADTRLYGENDLEAFFRKSGVIEQSRLNHTPFLVFRVTGDVVDVVVVDNSYDLVRDHSPETKVMVQWAGKFRSDYFQMTVADVAKALTERGLPIPTQASGQCTDCRRHVGTGLVGNPCRITVGYSRDGAARHCRGRISWVNPIVNLGESTSQTIEGVCSLCDDRVNPSRQGERCRRVITEPFPYECSGIIDVVVES